MENSRLWEIMGLACFSASSFFDNLQYNVDFLTSEVSAMKGMGTHLITPWLKLIPLRFCLLPGE